ncbi:MAG: hypothetical protein IT473_07870 [Lysobacter sp.]|nr:hypothetical protein [Lysobacter sp.]
MAEKLKRENDILTLKIELSPSDRVRCTLQFLDGGQLQSESLWQGDAAEFGVTPSGGGRPSAWLRNADFRLPQALPDAVKRGIDHWLSMGPWREPALWVHLAKPYGALRYVPWERLLFDAVSAPILMLPDFIFPPPLESASTLDVAICASAPLDCEHHHIVVGLHDSIGAILHGSDRPVRVHVFADRTMHDVLRDGGVPSEVMLHDPETAAPYVETDPSSRLLDQAGVLRSPWLLWMREGLKDFSTDAVHFVCHGHLSGTSGAMLFAQSPLGRTDNYLAGPVGCTELSGFLTQVGAWSTSFSAPADNHSPGGLRALADEIAQSLPGPMILFDQRYGDAGDLMAGYRFVHSQQPQSPPRSRALYLYCQPYLLSDERGGGEPSELVQHISQRAELQARNAPQLASVQRSLRDYTGDATTAARPMSQQPTRKSISAVTAATERLAEQMQAQYQQVLRDQVIPESIAHDEMTVAMDTMGLLRQAVGQIEKRRLIGEIDKNLAQMQSDYLRMALPEVDISEKSAPAEDSGEDSAETTAHDGLRAQNEHMAYIQAATADLAELSLGVEIDTDGLSERLRRAQETVDNYERRLQDGEEQAVEP